MSQQGADDWWQKLYEDPDAGPEPDPGDTLDNRFRSAAGLTTDPAAAPEPEQAPPWPPEPPQATLPNPRPEPVPPSTAPPMEARPVDPGQGPAPLRQDGPAEVVPEPPPAPPWAPATSVPPQDPGSGLPARPPVADARRQEPPPAPPVHGSGLLPGPRSAPEGQDAGLGQYRPLPAEGGAAPRDPRTGDATGYALGGVDVPPAQPPSRLSAAPPAGPPAPPSGLSDWRGAVPREKTLTGEVPLPGPVPDPAAAAAAAAATERRPEVRHLGDRAPTYAAEPGALPPADPAALDGLTPDTVLEGARYGTYTLRAASLRGDSARFRGEARRDFLLTARFGSDDDALVLVALAGGDRAAPGAAEAAAELCRTVAAAVGRSQGRLAEDIRAGQRDALRSGLQRLTDRGYGRLRARAAELGLDEEAYTAGLRGLLLPVDPRCRTRVCFGVGAGGLFRLRSGQWQDLEHAGAADDAEGGFRFRAAVARPGDTLLLCSGGLAEPMREEAALPAELAARWAEPEPPGLAAFLADTQLRLKGYADDRTAAAVWEA